MHNGRMTCAPRIRRRDRQGNRESAGHGSLQSQLMLSPGRPGGCGYRCGSSRPSLRGGAASRESFGFRSHGCKPRSKLGEQGWKLGVRELAVVADDRTVLALIDHRIGRHAAALPIRDPDRRSSSRQRTTNSRTPNYQLPIPKSLTSAFRRSRSSPRDRDGRSAQILHCATSPPVVTRCRVAAEWPRRDDPSRCPPVGTARPADPVNPGAHHVPLRTP